MKHFLVFIFIYFAMGSSCKEEPPCIDESKINPEGICTMDYTPVCGCDNKTYSNICVAENSGVLRWDEGECVE